MINFGGNNAYVGSFIMPKCPVCGNGCVDIDTFCGEECRRKYYLENGCEQCGRPYKETEKGWKVPSYSGYGHTPLYCPDCQKKHKEYAKIEKEIEKQIKIIEKQIKPVFDAVSKMEDGDFYCWEEGISYREFTKNVEYYNAHETEIEKSKKTNSDSYDKIHELKKRLDEQHDLFYGERR